MVIHGSASGTLPASLQTGSGAKPETDATLCPQSRSVGSKVALVTLKALLSPSALRRLDGDAYRFCPDSDCEVVYFDSGADSVFRKHDLRIRVGMKETEDPIPICYCFDVAIADLRKEIQMRGTRTIPLMIAAEVRAGHCACEVRNPQGTCCLSSVSKVVSLIESETRGARP